MRKILTLLLMTLSTAAAASCCDLDGCFEVGGEALYWKPTGADFQYADRDPELSMLGTEHVSGSYDWGFRAFASYFRADCSRGITVDWTRLRVRDSGALRVSPDIALIFWLYDQTLLETHSRAHLHFNYDKVNVRFDHLVANGCRGRVLGYVGFRYVDIKENRGYFVRGLVPTGPSFATVSYAESTSFEGGGFEGGLQVRYSICGGFRVIARSGITAEVGCLKSSLQRDEVILDAPLTSLFTTPSRTICVPGADLRLGLDYTYKCDCVWICGELGYQMDYRWNALGLFEGQPIDSIPTSKRTSVGFGGLYFGLSARF